MTGFQNPEYREEVGIRSYLQAEEYLRKGRNKDRRPTPSGVHSYIERYEDGTIGIRYHNTIVLKWYIDGTVELSSGSWKTATTKSRLNTYLPSNFHIWQDKGIWFLHRLPWGDGYEPVVFEDGMKIFPNGTTSPSTTTAKELQALRKAVRQYVKGFMEALQVGEVGFPDSGDCWFCYMQVKDGQTLGEWASSDHIKSHIEEEYYVPSLIVHVVEVMGASSWVKHWLHIAMSMDGEPMEEKGRDGLEVKQLTSALRRYIYRQLGFAY